VVGSYPLSCQAPIHFEVKLGCDNIEDDEEEKGDGGDDREIEEVIINN
jgi:hypothetical protein